MTQIFSFSRQEDIQYQKDPSGFFESDLQNLYQKLDGYSSININKIKKSVSKKFKKTATMKLIENEKTQRKQTNNIASLIKKVKRDNLIQQFINKLKYTIIYQNLTEADQQQYYNIGKKRDQIQFKNNIKNGKSHNLFGSQKFYQISIILKLIIFLGIFYLNSLKIAFKFIENLQIVLIVLSIINIIYFSIEIVIMIYKVYNLKILFWKNLYYWLEKQDQLWEFLINMGLFLQLFGVNFINPMFIFLLMKQAIILIRKFKKVQISYVISINFQRYWQLLKIILLNFCIAHFLSIILNLMANIKIQGQQNWYVQKSIQQDANWFVKYIWGFYWGTNIMLSVGFGDISAQNHVQALMLIFVQTFACIILAYNISQVSKILQNISILDQQKKQKFKIFNQMGLKYQFQDDFKINILNHIDKSIEKKHQLVYLQQSLIEELPQKLKYQIKRQINKNVFQKAPFFQYLTKKTQNLLAQKVNKIFAHPEQFILKNNETWKILILRQGNLGLMYNFGSSTNNGSLIQEFTIQNVLNPQLISLKFIRKQKIKGDLKSLDFSILNALQIHEFQNFLRQHDNSMYEFYCSRRDKTQYNKCDLQIRLCNICNNSWHDKTQCPRLHFIPLKQHIIYKKQLIYKGNKLKRKRQKFQRKQQKSMCALKLLNFSFREDTQSYWISQYRSPDYVIQTQMSANSYFMQNIDISKKIDKCLSKLQQGLKLMKGEVTIQQLIFESAYNFKKYFPSNNPQNLNFLLNSVVNKKNQKVQLMGSKEYQKI